MVETRIVPAIASLFWLSFFSGLSWNAMKRIRVTISRGIVLLCRMLPVVLPHRLLPWLHRQGLFAQVNDADLARYWCHHAFFRTGIKAPSEKHHPIWIWGDDCQYGKRKDQKVMVCMLGHVLDPRTNSYECCYPLWACGYEPRLNRAYIICLGAVGLSC